MKKTLLAVLLAVPMFAVAAPPGGASKEGDKREGRDADRMEKVEKRMRMAFVVGLAEALSLNESEALKLADRAKGFDEKRRPLRMEMHEAMKTIKAAADNDATALPQVDAAVNKVVEARRKMGELDREMYLSLAKDLSPQKKAQLALFMGQFKKNMKDHHDGKGGRRNRGGTR